MVYVELGLTGVATAWPCVVSQDGRDVVPHKLGGAREPSLG